MHSYIFERYICQYVEVRRLTTRNSGIWLSIQGGLALIRVAVWVWDPAFDDSLVSEVTADRTEVYDLTEVRLIALWATLQHNFRAPKDLDIPEEVLPAFQVGERNPHGMFELAQKLRQDNSGWDASFALLRDADCCWEMPAWFFMAWVDHYVRPESHRDGYPFAKISCSVIKDRNGGFHFVPCWRARISLHACRNYQGDQDEIRNSPFSNIRQRSTSTYHDIVCRVSARVFGNPDIEGRCIFAFDSQEPKLPYSKTYVVGWDSPLPKKLLSALSSDERFRDNSFEVRPSFSFSPPDSGTRVDNSKWAGLVDPMLIPHFDYVRKAYNSIWQDLELILKPDPNRNRQTPSTTSNKSPPATPPVPANQSQPPTSSEIELDTFTTASEGDQRDITDARSQY